MAKIVPIRINPSESRELTGKIVRVFERANKDDLSELSPKDKQAIQRASRFLIKRYTGGKGEHNICNFEDSLVVVDKIFTYAVFQLPKTYYKSWSESYDTHNVDSIACLTEDQEVFGIIPFLYVVTPFFHFPSEEDYHYSDHPPDWLSEHSISRLKASQEYQDRLLETAEKVCDAKLKYAIAKIGDKPSFKYSRNSFIPEIYPYQPNTRLSHFARFLYHDAEGNLKRLEERLILAQRRIETGTIQTRKLLDLIGGE